MNATVIINLTDPQQAAALRTILIDVMSQDLPRIDDDEIITCDTLVKEYGIRSMTTLNKYQRMGLPYIKGRPRRYRRRDVKEFFRKINIANGADH